MNHLHATPPKQYSHYTRGMVFGVFDLFHKGHEYLLDEAAKRCNTLIVVVTVPEIVMQLKQKTPKHSLSERIERIRAHNKNLTVIEGDHILGSWNVLRDRPVDIVFLGHDQQGIAGELDKKQILYHYFDKLPA